MNAAVQQVLDEVRGAARFRWWGLLAAWVICTLGWSAIFFLPDMYEARARVYVDTRTVLAPVLQGLTINQDVDAQLNLVRQSLLGRPQLEMVVREADLDLQATTPEQRARLIDDVRERIQLGVQAGRDAGSVTSAIYTLGFQDPSRETSLRVVDILLNTFVEETLGGKRTGSETAQTFLTQQIEEYELRLREAEQRLADFKRRNVGQMPGEQGDYFTRLQTEMEAVDKARAALSISTTRRDELQRQLRGEVPFSSAADRSATQVGGAARPGGTDTATRIAETRARLDELLLRFTERHPDVIATQETLVQLEQRLQTEVEALRRGDTSALLASGASVNPVYQSIQLALNQVEVEIAALRGEIADRERSVGSLRRLVDTVPEVEAEYARLNRDYDVTRSQYTALVDRLEKARLGGEAESTESIRFEVIDPPTAGFEPVAPNRPRLMALVLVVGLGAGGGLAYLLHMLKPVFTSTRMLNEITGLPVLGAVSMTWLDRFRTSRRRSYVWYSLSVGLLLVAFAAALQLNQVGARLVQNLIG